MTTQTKKQGLLFSEPSYSETGVWCELAEVSKPKWQLACHPKRKVSMRHLMGEQNIENCKINIAGRENELLSIENLDADNSLVHELMTNFICEKL